jgi:hypothetical protein
MIISRSKKAKMVALSSSEAELLALLEVTKCVTWCRHFLEELGYPQREATEVMEDNSAVIDWMGSVKAQARTRHLNKICNFCRQRVDLGIIKMVKVASADNVADLFTKGLPGQLFMNHRHATLGLGLLGVDLAMVA